jgi:N-acyl-D-aspartate/D-glutamate deacylase
VVAKFNGLYTTHTRKEAVGYLDGIKEAIEIAKRSGVRLQISHIETHYPAWGEQEEALNLINYARIKGLNIGCDVIPYLWSATSLYTLVPRWIYDGGPKMIALRMQDELVRKKVAQEIRSSKQELTTGALAKDGLWDKIKILSYPIKPTIEGKTIKDLSQEKQIDPLDLVFDLLGSGPPFPSIMAQAHNENDIRKVIKFNQAIIESDLYTISPQQVGTSKSQHPRGFGTFPLIFRKYVRGETREDLPEERGEKLLSLEEAVRRITSLPAERLRLKDRGILKEGMFADITIFDENRIQDKATYQKPNQYPEGIEYVIVNGRIIVENEKFTNCKSGMIIRQRN